MVNAILQDHEYTDIELGPCRHYADYADYADIDARPPLLSGEGGLLGEDPLPSWGGGELTVPKSASRT